MARDYEALLNKYNIAISQIRTMREQMETKDRQRKEYEARVDVVDGHTRKLCEMILAKDKSQMTLGAAKSWHGYSTDELISMAMKVFVQYNKERTDLLNQVMGVAEQRTRELESLKDQISQMMTGGNVATATYEEIMAQAEKQNAQKAAINQAPNKVQQAVADGRVTVIIEEDSDCEDQEMDAISEMMDVATQAQLTPGAKPISRAPQKSDLMKKAKEKTVTARMVNLQEYTEKYSPNEWEVLRIIGSTGAALQADIQAAFGSFNTAKGACYRACTNLCTSNALHQESVVLPLSKKKSVYKLTEIGRCIYKEHFGKDAVASEMDEICAEHDNPEHGYGILELEKVLVDSGRYRSVSSKNRKHPIEVEYGGQKLKYIPDLICKGERFTDYFEYERGKHTQQDFNMKCNKMSRVTKFLNFVTPNQDVARVVKKQAEAWIASRGPGGIRSAIVRIGTISSIQNEGDWKVVFELNKGPDAVKDELG